MRQLTIPKSITPRDYQSIDRYFNDIEKIKMITPAEEALLGEKIRQGDKVALERLTTSNLRFVVSVAKQYQNQGLSLGDLINEGNIGLIIAAKRFDETRGFKFISYAVWWIRQSIMVAIAEKVRMVRLPSNHIVLLSKIRSALSKLEQIYGRKPSYDELSEYLDIEPELVAELIGRFAEDRSLDEPLGQNAEYTFIDILHNKETEADRGVTQESISIEIFHSLKILSKRDRELLILYFGLGISGPLSPEEIGLKFCMSKEHVSRLKDKALNRLRESSNALNLQSCLSWLYAN